jgi:HAE1 family hydrophobic/amphiphilic exporter-1
MFDMSSMMGGGFGSAQFAVELRGHLGLSAFHEVSERFMAGLSDRGGFVDLDKSLKLGLPEITVLPDREKAASMGVDAANLAGAIRSMIGGVDIATFKEGGNRFDIRMRVEEQDRADPDSIGRLYVRNRAGEVVEMRNLVDIETRASPTDITRSGRQRSVTISANLDGKRLGAAVADAEAVAAEVLPEGVSITFGGDAEQMQESFGQFAMALLLAVLIIYMVLAAQFESFVHPLTVMLAVPLAMVGALGALLTFGLTLNLFSLIGIIMLFGLVTKNSILLVDYANKLRASGLDKVEAMRRAAPVRMRPVLMTAISMIFGVLPAALGIGPGAESRRPMAVATAAGMMSSTVLTLLVVPVFYIMLDNLVEWFKRQFWRILSRSDRDVIADEATGITLR